MAHNVGSTSDIMRVQLSPCNRILVIFDSDRLSVWDSRYCKEAFKWNYGAGKNLKCDKILMTSHVFMFLPGINNQDNEQLSILNFVEH